VLPKEPLSRRAVILAAAVVAGCDDTGGGVPPTSSRPGAGGSPQPTHDPATVAALLTVATQIQQVSARYAAVVRRHAVLRTRLAPAVKHRAAHLARLEALGGAAPAATATKPVPATPAAAVKELVAREQALAVAHATAAVKLSGEPARVLAMIAAAESQLAIALGRR
jgi:hypothetical protein